MTFDSAVLELTGMAGYAAWFQGSGQQRRGAVLLRGPEQQDQYKAVIEHLGSLGFEVAPLQGRSGVRGVVVAPKSAVAFMKALKPGRAISDAA